MITQSLYNFVNCNIIVHVNGYLSEVSVETCQTNSVF